MQVERRGTLQIKTGALIFGRGLERHIHRYNYVAYPPSEVRENCAEEKYCENNEDDVGMIS